MENRLADSRVKFRHLQCFLAVAQFGSVQQAAESLSVTQPAVSKTIAELDEELRQKMSGLAGDGGEAGVELEGGQVRLI